MPTTVHFCKFSGRMAVFQIYLFWFRMRLFLLFFFSFIFPYILFSFFATVLYTISWFTSLKQFAARACQVLVHSVCALLKVRPPQLSEFGLHTVRSTVIVSCDIKNKFSDTRHSARVQRQSLMAWAPRLAKIPEVLIVSPKF